METEIVQNAMCSPPSPDQTTPNWINAGHWCSDLHHETDAERSMSTKTTVRRPDLEPDAHQKYPSNQSQTLKSQETETYQFRGQNGRSGTRAGNSGINPKNRFLTAPQIVFHDGTPFGDQKQHITNMQPKPKFFSKTKEMGQKLIQHIYQKWVVYSKFRQHHDALLEKPLKIASRITEIGPKMAKKTNLKNSKIKPQKGIVAAGILRNLPRTTRTQQLLNTLQRSHQKYKVPTLRIA
uniref:Uncharacterized protein n=1 Tax=Solanum demissum TaxID=50514 RepID=Q0KIJ8_SOLDE|nr:hypothetical protein SDM1_52t00015 [Solanum demissum]